MLISSLDSRPDGIVDFGIFAREETVIELLKPGDVSGHDTSTKVGEELIIVPGHRETPPI
jgi:hypothetical protein